MTYGGTTPLSVSLNVPVDREQLPWTDCPISTAGKSLTWPEPRTAQNCHMIAPGCRFSHCGLFKWERDGMLKVRFLNKRACVWMETGVMALFVLVQEKTGPKVGGELLLPRGEEHGKFLNSK